MYFYGISSIFSRSNGIQSASRCRSPSFVVLIDLMVFCVFWCVRLLCDASWCSIWSLYLSLCLCVCANDTIFFVYLFFCLTDLRCSIIHSLFSRRLRCRCEQRKTVVHLIVSLFDRLNFSFCSTLNTETKHVSLFFLSQCICVCVCLCCLFLSGSFSVSQKSCQVEYVYTS